MRNASRSAILQLSDHLHSVITECIGPQSLQQGSTAIKQLVSSLLSRLDAKVDSIEVSNDSIEVKWRTSLGAAETAEKAIPLLESGRLHQAVLLLELVRSDDSDNQLILYNLGVAYSELGYLRPSIELLRKLSVINPNHVNGSVALGVALLKNGDEEEALGVLSKSVELDQSNPWANRNLGAIYLRRGKGDAAIKVLLEASKSIPTDTKVWLGLANAYEMVGDASKASDAYKTVIALDEYDEVAEEARQALSRIAFAAFRSAGQSPERMDAVMYLLGAIQKFDNMPTEKIQSIGFEIAMLGTKGINVNDAESSYNLQNLAGTFTGLHLVCLEYAAFKRFAPDANIGFDLSKEYEMALSLHRQRPS